MRNVPRWIVASIVLATVVAGCGKVKKQQRRLTDPAQASTIDRKSPFIKAHMRDGAVYVLSPWRYDSAARTVSGQGQRLDVNRIPTDTGTHVIALDSVALFETNVVTTHGSVAALAVVTGASVALTAMCLTTPKACFGSCPTFYVSDGTRSVLEAEGFSASVAPVLEATDIDALYRARPASRTFEVQMTNEALETHVVRSARVLAVPRGRGERVFATQGGEFWQTSAITPPQRCSASEGNCLDAVRAVDGNERFSATDSTDLATRETIDLEFSIAAGDSLGLVISSRQTLLSTYLLYQAMSYMGRSAGQWLAALQRGDSRVREQSQSLGRVLGGIEVQAQDSSGGWATVGQTQETGPLANDVRIVPLPHLRPGTTRLRLRLTRGHWRIDYLALARLTGLVSPVRLDPVTVRRGTTVDRDALAMLTDSSRTLVTRPGDELTLVYQLPQDFARYELFLESRGYYLEWMRQEWLAEEDLSRATMMFLRPAEALRALAPEFKAREPDMEAAFWRSRYVRH